VALGPGVDTPGNWRATTFSLLAVKNEHEETQMQKCEVQLYSLSTCSHCKDTKEFLDKCGVDYTCVDVDKLDPEPRREFLEKIRQLNPKCTFPTIVIGDNVVVGFKEDEIKAGLGIS
jgi:glutaredoxin-like protein NrdH